MSENVTHTAVLDDSLRLMGASDEICPAFKEVARAHHDFARLGALTRGADRASVKLLEAFRSRWATRSPADMLEPKLAFVLGWLCHRAADRQMKPLFRQANPVRTESPTECSICHDAFLFREVYASGTEAPYHPGMFDAMPDAGAVEELFRVLLQRALVGLHTLIPDESDPEGWLGRLFAARQAFTVDLTRYAAAIARPEPEKVRRYVIEMNFYDPGDPLIAAARRLQRGGHVSAAEVRQARATEARSHYAQALSTALGYLHAASEFFTSDTAPQALAERLDIGKPGRDGKGV